MNRWKIITFMMLLAVPIMGPGQTPVPPQQPITADQDPQYLTRYTGDIGGTLRIGLQLRFDKGGSTANGCYFYYKYCKDIRIDAAIDGRDIVIREFDPAGKLTGNFTGRFMEADPRHHYTPGSPLGSAVIAGTWSKPDGSGRHPFYLIDDNTIYAPTDASEYGVPGFDDPAVVNQFATKFLDSVAHGDRKAVAGAIRYPVTVTLEGKRRRINSAADLIKNYDAIFSPAFAGRLATFPPIHLFARDQGVMIGRGQIWIGPVGTDKETVPKVIAISNGGQNSPEIRDYFGDWKITRVAGFARVSAMDEKQAAQCIGARVTYGTDLSTFQGPYGKEKNPKPDYQGRTITPAEFFEQSRDDPKDLGISQDRIDIVDVNQTNGSGWTCCGGDFIVKSYGSIIVSWDGTYFEMTRSDPPVRR